MKHAAVVIGNSSSGVVESVPLHVPALDLGTRQEGRPHADSVLWAPFSRAEIVRQLEIALNDTAFLERVRTVESPFGKGNCGNNIAQILASVPLDQRLLAKKYCLPS